MAVLWCHIKLWISILTFSSELDNKPLCAHLLAHLGHKRCHAHHHAVLVRSIVKFFNISVIVSLKKWMKQRHFKNQRIQIDIFYASYLHLFQKISFIHNYSVLRATSHQENKTELHVQMLHMMPIQIKGTK